MIALGFTCHARTGLTADTGSCGLARRAFVALEYEGLAWQALVAHREAERDRAQANANYHSDYLDNLIKFGSRLVMIDASRDGIALRRAHPARNVIILPATARAWLTTDLRNPSGGAAMTGSITPLRRRSSSPLEIAASCSCFRRRSTASAGHRDLRSTSASAAATNRGFRTFR